MDTFQGVHVMVALERVCARVLESLEERALFSTFNVTNTNDTGPGSLRAAITQANSTALADIIHFNIPGAGVHTISPKTTLPTITSPLSIDGYTQPGSSVNTLKQGN